MTPARAYLTVLLLGLVGQNFSLPIAQARASIEGVVVASESGQPLRKATILLQIFDPNNLSTHWTNVTPAITDEKGRFVLEDLRAGSYRGVVEREGYATQKYGQASILADGKTLELASGERSRMDFKLVKAGVITGKVLDEYGRPAQGMRIQAYVELKTPERHSLIPIADTSTNDRGEYRLFGLAPGPYVVSVVLRLNAGAGAPVPQLYYPGVLAPESSGDVNLTAGETPNIDFKLRQFSPVNIRGKVGIPFEQTPVSTEVPRLGVQAIVPSSFVTVQLVREQDLNQERPPFRGIAANRDGSFEFPGVFAPGRYRVIATGGPEPRNDEEHWFAAMTRIEVSGANVNGIMLDLKPGVKISGRIESDAAIRGALQMRDLQLVLTSTDDVVLSDRSEVRVSDDGYSRVQPTTTMRVPVKDDGSFTFEYVLPIEYRLTLEGMPKEISVKNAELGSANALVPFGVESGDNRQLVVTLGAATGETR